MEQITKLTKYKNLDLDELNKNLRAEYSSLQSGYDRVQAKRMQGYAGYAMIDNSATIEGRSTTCDSIVFDKIEWLTATLLRPMVEGDEAINVIPEGPEDVVAAEHMRELLTYQLKKKNDWFLLHQTMIKQAQIGGDAYAKLHWIPENKIDGAAYVKIEPIRPSQIRYDWTKSNFYDSDVVIHDTIVNRSDIEEMKKDTKSGYIAQNIDFLLDNFNGATNEQGAGTGNSDINTERTASKMWVGDGVDKDSDSGKFYTMSEHWTTADIDGSGIVKSVVATYIHDVIIRFIENPFPDGKPPFVYCQGIREPFSSLGWSQNDVLGDIQKNATAISRDIIDNLAHQTNGMWEVDSAYVDPQAMRLLRDGVAGSIIQVDRPQSINPLPVLPLSPQAFEYRQVLQMDADSRSGFTKSEQMDTKLLRSTATAANIVSNAGEMRIWESAQRYIETFLKPAIRKVIAYNQKWLPETSIQKVFGEGAGQWIFPKKEDIAGYFALDIQISLSSDKQEKIGQMVQYLQYAGPYAQQIPEVMQAIKYMSTKMTDLMGLKDFEAFMKKENDGFRGAVYPEELGAEAAGIGAPTADGGQGQVSPEIAGMQGLGNNQGIPGGEGDMVNQPLDIGMPQG